MEKMQKKANMARPFLKWVGGKSQLLPQLDAALPQGLAQMAFTYIEPFVGGGAMLFHILRKCTNIKRVVVNDINSNLTDAYQTIKDEPLVLVSQLKHIEQQYRLIADGEARRAYYTEMRHRFNDAPLARVEKTAILIFLNRTCFNGLYRENAKGQFNVPFGRYTNPTICNEEIILADSELLNRYDVQIMNGDFRQTEQALDPDGQNFFYFDPPYRPLNATSSFTSYVKEAFSDDRQRELADFCRKLSRCDNVWWMLSNADCAAVNPEDVFLEELYDGFDIRRVYASRMVNSNASKRGKLTELLVRNYTTPTASAAEAREYVLFNEAI